MTTQTHIASPRRSVRSIAASARPLLYLAAVGLFLFGPVSGASWGAAIVCLAAALVATFLSQPPAQPRSGEDTSHLDGLFGQSADEQTAPGRRR